MKSRHNVTQNETIIHVAPDAIVCVCALVLLLFAAMLVCSTASAIPTCTCNVTPSNIETNSTGTFTARINCTDAGGINTSRFFMMTTVAADAIWGPPDHWSIRPPVNDWAQSNDTFPQILRSYNRGEGAWYDNYGIFTDTNNSSRRVNFSSDRFSYGVFDNTSSHVTITNGTNWAELNYTWNVEPTAFRNAMFLNLKQLETETKKEYKIYKDNPLLVKFWDIEHIRGTNNYTVCMFNNINYSGSLTENLTLYYCNNSYRTAPEELPDNMDGNILLMHFNNNSDYGENYTHVYDFSGNGNNGTVEGDPVWNSSAGEFDGAYMFDGTDDYIEAPAMYDINGSNPMTIEFWFKTTFNSKSQPIIDAGTVRNKSEALEFWLTAEGEIGNAPPTNEPGLYLGFWHNDIYMPSVNYYDGNWHHVLLTLYNNSDGNATVEIYYDGTRPDGYRGNLNNWYPEVEPESQPFKLDSPPDIETMPFWIGRSRYKFWGVGNTYFNGIIDEVAVYNRSLSADEIIDHYTRGVIKPVDSPNCAYLESLNTTALNDIDYTSRNSSYSNFCFDVNNSKIGSINTTDTFYIAYESATTTGNYTVRYTNGSSGTNVSFNDSKVAWSSTDNATNWTQARFTPDLWFASIKSGDQFQLGVYVENNTDPGRDGNYTNFTLYTDDIGDVNKHITKPNITYYKNASGDIDSALNGTYSGNMTIRVEMADDPDGAGTVNHSLTLRYPNGSWCYTINKSFRSLDDNVTIVFDTEKVLNGVYKMKVTATADDDPTDVTSFLTPANFTIDNPTYVNTTGWWRCGAAFNASSIPITSAVENATSGERICVLNGNYDNESANVNRSHLSLYAKNPYSVNVSAPEPGPVDANHVFNVTAGYVNITGFNVTGATGDDMAGIYLCNADNCNIRNNMVSGNTWDIRIENSSSTFESNTLNNTTVSFTYSGNLSLKGVGMPAGDPPRWNDIGKFINATNQSVGAWLFLNFSYSESDVSGLDESDLTIRKYNGTTWAEVSGVQVDSVHNIIGANITNFCVIVPGTVPPDIISFAPPTPVNNTEGAIRKFNITINQTVNVMWYINGTNQDTDTSVTAANYTNTSAKIGVWNVSAVAENANGIDMQEWVWNVKDSTPPVITIDTPTTLSPVYRAGGAQFWVNFTYTELYPKNYTIRVGNSTAIINSTNKSIVGGTTANESFNLNTSAADGWYNVSVEMYDNSSNYNITDQNDSVAKDTKAPDLIIDTPTTLSPVYRAGGAQFWVNFTYTELYPKNYTVTIRNATTIINSNDTTNVVGGTGMTANESFNLNTAAADGWYNVSVEMYDILLNRSITYQNNSVAKDTKAPDLIIDTPTTLSPVYRAGGAQFWVNFTYTELYPKNYTVTIRNATTIINSNDTTNVVGGTGMTANESFNLNTAAADGWYNVSVEMYDILLNRSITYQNNSVAKDTKAPDLIIDTPTTLSPVYRAGGAQFWVNFTYTELYPKNYTVTIRNATTIINSNDTTNVVGGTGMTANESFNLNTAAADGWYNVSVEMYDILLNRSITYQNNSVAKDTKAPDLIIDTPTTLSPVYRAGGAQFWVNFTYTELYPKNYTVTIRNATTIINSNDTTNVVGGTGMTANESFNLNTAAADGWYNVSVEMYDILLNRSITYQNNSVAKDTKAPDLIIDTPTTLSPVYRAGGAQFWVNFTYTELYPKNYTVTIRNATTIINSNDTTNVVGGTGMTANESFNLNTAAADGWYNVSVEMYDILLNRSITYQNNSVAKDTKAPDLIIDTPTTLSPVYRAGGAQFWVNFTYTELYPKNYTVTIRNATTIINSNDTTNVVGGTGMTANESFNLNTAAADGWYNVSVEMYDILLNRSITYQNNSVAKDTKAPDLIIDTPTTLSPVYRAGGAQFWVNFTYTELYPKNYTVTIRNATTIINSNDTTNVVGGTGMTANESFNLNTAAADGWYNVSVEMYDILLNRSITYQNNSVAKDTTPPVITIDTPTTLSPVYRAGGEQFWVNFTYTELYPKNYTVTIRNATTIINSNDTTNVVGGTGMTANESFNLNTAAADGWYNVSVEMYDILLNRSITYQNNSVAKDTKAPDLIIDTPTTLSPVYRAGGAQFWVNFTYTELYPKNYTVTIRNATTIINSNDTTNVVGGTGMTANESFNLNTAAADGWYNVSVEMYDILLNRSITYQNNSVAKDTTPPVITIDTPTTLSPVYRAGGEQFWVNFTYTELYPKNYTIRVGNSTAIINSTNKSIVGGTTANESFNLNTAAADGWYNVSVEMYDILLNRSITYQNNSVAKDTTPPVITIDTPTTLSPVYRAGGAQFWVNFTYTELYPKNYTVTIRNATTIINSNDTTNVVGGTGMTANESFNLNTAAADGWYNVSVEMYDILLNRSITYQNNSVAKDTTPPVITIDTPTTLSPVYRAGGEQFWVNFTYTELYPKNYTIRVGNSTAIINSTNKSIVGGTTANESFNLNTAAADGWYNVSVEMYDILLNRSITYQNNSVAKDTTPPVITIDTPTTLSPVYRAGGAQFWVNFTYTELYPKNYTVTIRNATTIINSNDTTNVVGGTGMTANESFNLNTYAADGWYNVSVEMYDLLLNRSITYQNNSVAKDTTPPVITIDTPTTLSPVYRDGGEQFWVNFTYTELYPKNYTVTIRNATTIINSTNKSIVGGTTANESFNLNTSAADGWYNVSVEMYDLLLNRSITYQNDSVEKYTKVACGCGDICVNTGGWWRDGAAFNASGTAIQHAINNATDGDTICVAAGTYKEDVNVSKGLTLAGEGADVVEVTNRTAGSHAFEVTADWVNISGFNVTGATGVVNAGIYLNGRQHCNILDNNASGNYFGICLNDSSNNTVTGNTASNNDYGIALECSSSNNTVTGNTASNNDYGIVLECSSSNNTVTGNTASNNSDWDVYIIADSDSIFEDNILNGTTVSFTYNGNVSLKGVGSPKAAPSGQYNIGKFINATNQTAGAWLYLNFSYSTTDVSGLDESKLKVWKYNGTEWVEDGWNSARYLNTTGSVVGTNITNFSVFAPMAPAAAGGNGGSSGNGRNGTYPPGWFETPTPTQAIPNASSEPTLTPPVESVTPTTEPAMATPAPAEAAVKSKNTWLWWLIAILALIAIAVTVYMRQRKEEE